MKTSVFSAVLVLLVASACSSVARKAEPPTVPAASGFDALGISIKLDQRKLSNGLTVIMVEDHAVPVVAYQTWFKVGSVDEKPGRSGMAHLFEHLMFKGTPKYGPRQFFHQLEAKGADVNAFTTRDYTVFHQTFVPSLLEKVIDMEADRLANMRVTEQELSNEKQVVFEERRLRVESSPDGKIQEAIWALAFQRHPYRWPVIGYVPDLISMTHEQLMAFFQDFYQPANAAIVIVGDFDANTVFKAIEKSYGGIASRPRPRPSIANEPEQFEQRRITLVDGVATYKVMHAYPIPSAFDDDVYAIDVLSNILFEGQSARAVAAIVENQDLALSVSGTSFTPMYPGLLFIGATLTSGVKVPDYERALWAEITRVQNEGVSALEVQRAVRQLTVQIIDGVRTPHGLAQLIGTVHTIFGDANRVSDDFKKYLSVTPADVKRVANRYIQHNARSIVVVEPESICKKEGRCS